MIPETPRLRMIAGPNGSGKSRIREILRELIVGVFVNADEIQLALDSDAGLDFSKYSVDVGSESLNQFVAQHPLRAKAGFTSAKSELEVTAGVLTRGPLGATGYLSTVLADFIRKKLIENRTSFTFETVMSSPDKIETLELARSNGFRTYLYYIATEDPTINVERVGFRVKMGGHSVPEAKIRDS